MSKKTLIILSIIPVAAILFFVAFNKYSSSKSIERSNPKVGEIIEAVYGLGKVKTNKLFQLRLGVVSTVEKVFVKEGDTVNKGDKLISLDSGTTFRAPFNGTVTIISAHEGETAGTQSPILTMADLNERFIEIVLEQEGALRIKKGQTARVGFESMRGQSLTGKVAALYPREDEFIATIAVENLDPSILPGMSADVSVEIGKIKGMTVPAKAIRNAYVTIERDGKKQKIKVEVGLVDGLSAEIKNSDLSENDVILIPKE